MAQRKTTRADAPPSINTAVVSETAVSSLATDPAPTVKVNKAHLAEVKTALDDILKKVGAAVVCGLKGGGVPDQLDRMEPNRIRIALITSDGVWGSEKHRRGPPLCG